jgi:hypothetical protein
MRATERETSQWDADADEAEEMAAYYEQLEAAGGYESI